MLITNGIIFGEDGRFRHGDVEISKKIITEISHDEASSRLKIQGQEEVIDANGLYVVPGFVDIHLHGAAGHDFCDETEEAFRAIAEYELSHGVTSMLPTTMTYPHRKLHAIMTTIADYATRHSSIKGINMEGPFISEGKKGAQNERYIHQPDAELFTCLQEASGGLIKQVTIAPEIPGAIDFVREVSDECVVSVAHTEANYEEAMAAFEAGATHVTHLHNAMPPFGHREPGVVGAAFDCQDVFIELICDGEHVHPAMVRATFQLFGSHRICMISDSMRATGMPPGVYTLGGQEVLLQDGRAILKDGTLAGAVSTLYDNFKRAVLQMHIPLEDALAACTITPAKSMRIESECGVLSVGRRADILLLDGDLNIKYVIKDGEVSTSTLTSYESSINGII